MKFSMNSSPLCIWNTVTAEALIVIPRSRSRSMSSRICSLNSRSVIAPARMSSRSERVLLPWSMWAMMEKLRICIDRDQWYVAAQVVTTKAGDLARALITQPAIGGRKPVEMIEAVIKPEKLQAVMSALATLSILGATAFEVKGYGRQAGHTERFRGGRLDVGFV